MMSLLIVEKPFPRGRTSSTLRGSLCCRIFNHIGIDSPTIGRNDIFVAFSETAMLVPEILCRSDTAIVKWSRRVRHERVLRLYEIGKEKE